MVARLTKLPCFCRAVKCLEATGLKQAEHDPPAPNRCHDARAVSDNFAQATARVSTDSGAPATPAQQQRPPSASEAAAPSTPVSPEPELSRE